MGLKHYLLAQGISIDFSDDFWKKAETHALEQTIVKCLFHGTSPFHIIEELCKSNNEMRKKLEEIYMHGIPPVIIQCQKEELIKEVKDK